MCSFSNVLHRNSKPVLLIDSQDTLYILDFGIASIEEGLSKQSGGSLIMGTPGYMAPEQAINKNITFKADIFALGVVAFEILGGERPFSGSDFTTATKSVIRDRPKTLSVVNPEIPVAVDSIFDSVLSKAPEIRPNSAIEFVDALAKALNTSLEVGSFKPNISARLETDSSNFNSELADSSSSDSIVQGKSNFKKWTVLTAAFCLVMLAIISLTTFLPTPKSSLNSQTRAIDTYSVIEAELDREILVNLPEKVKVDLSKDLTLMSSIELISLMQDSTEADFMVKVINQAVDRSIPYLFEGLYQARNHDSYVVRELVMKSFGKLDDSRVEVILLNALDDYDARVRLAAARALKKRGTSKSLNYLVAKKTRDSSPAVQEALENAIQSIK
ncbi:MAG: HEAT repeat domain-containing protein [Bdellovibrionota bacterium]